MDNSCWKCGSIYHHGRECTSTDVRAKADIQRFRNTVTHSQQYREKSNLRLNYYLDKLHVYDSVPPFILVKAEVERLSNFYHEVDLRNDDIYPNCNTDVGEMKTKLEQVVTLHSQFSSQNEAVREIRATRKLLNRQWRSRDEEEKLLLLKMDDLSDCQVKLNDTLYQKRSRLSTAVSFLAFWITSEEDLRSFISNGLEIFNGRPLRIPDVKREWPEKKALLSKMKEEVEKYEYLLMDSAKQDFATRLGRLNDNWIVLKECKYNQERERRDECKLCFDALVTVALGCGHVFCRPCIQDIDTCPYCRRQLTQIIPLHFS